ncbi:MAG TPA: cysteine desulfurase-like protein [Gemmatimonadaceae bacterium]|nr:cysteine desulfurase-like protein [Gemmatimonadaceae bacterium]
MSTPASTGAVASVEQVRAQFPALARRHNGHPVAYLDGPGGTQVPAVVADAVRDYLLHHNANTHWAYPTSEETDAMIANARIAVAEFLNGRPDEVAFGQNMTSLTFHLARGLGRAWGPGDEVVITELDHHANVAPWRALERDRGITIRSVRMRVEDGTLDMDDLARAIGPRTRLVAIGAASNALGTISDVRAAVQLAHEQGALVFVDAVHYAPHQLVDVQALGCDFLACSAYKFYGPHIGILWGRRALIEAADVPRLAPAPQDSPERLETGTQSHEAIVGAQAAVDFLASLGSAGSRRASLEQVFAALHARGDALLRRLWSGLEAIPGVTLFGPRPGSPRTPTVAFTLKGHRTTDLAHRLAQQGLFLSNGDFYAATVIERLGQQADGVMRVGCSCYTTADEVERLIEGVAAI